MVPSHPTFPDGIVLPLHGTVPTRWGNRRPSAGVWVCVNNHAVMFVEPRVRPTRTEWVRKGVIVLASGRNTSCQGSAGWEPNVRSNGVTDSPCLWWAIGRVVCWRLRRGMEDVAVGPGYE